MWLYYSVMSPNDADGMANSEDLDQTAPLGAYLCDRGDLKRLGLSYLGE